ncbi:hypothetical protein JX265_013529 [Neoarthrinium moseri]|uniref:Ankyrin n=1 Tax=Neoarthrinium moseri TaxID=1658444 RepID=A0A9P9W8I2_9PEZI|nr:hypothetical protein JX265_013529 [Neoarthrinium moseri]
MASLSECPFDVIRMVLDLLTEVGDLWSLALTDRRLYRMTNPELYGRKTLESRRGLHWAAFLGRPETVELFLENGADPNWYWCTVRGGPWSNDFYGGTRSTPLACGECKDPSFDTLQDRYGRVLNSRWREYVKTQNPHVRFMLGKSTDEIDGGNRQAGSSTWTPLHLAAREGHAKIVKLLLGHGADPSLSSYNVCACRDPKRLAVHERPLVGGRAQDVIPYLPWSALHLAICHGHDNVASILMDAGASRIVDGPKLPFRGGRLFRGTTALHTACQHGRLDTVRYIVENSFQTDLDVEDALGETALDYAYLYGQWPCLEYLLQRGARRDGRYNLLAHPIHGHSFKSASRLLGNGLRSGTTKTGAGDLHNDLPTAPLIHASLSRPWGSPPRGRRAEFNSRRYARAKRYETPPEASILKDGLECLRYLLQSGEDVNGRGMEDATPLAVAVRHAPIEVLKMLLEAGASVNATDVKGRTALFLACVWTRSSEVIELLLKYGANPERQGRSYGPIGKACQTYLGPRADQSKHEMGLEVVKILLRHGPRPTVKSLGDDLYLAMGYSNLAIARLLLSRLDLELSNAADYQRLFRSVWTLDTTCLRTVLDLDKENGIVKGDLSLLRLVRYKASSTEAASLLLDRGAQCVYWSEKDGSALYWAVANRRDTAFARRLLDAGANPNQLYVSGQQRSCALLEAVRYREHDYVKLLLEKGSDVNLMVHEPCAGQAESTPLLRAVQQRLHPDRDTPGWARNGKAPIERMRDNSRGIIETLLAAPSVLSWTEQTRETCLRYACQSKSPKLLEMLVNAGAGSVFRERVADDQLHSKVEQLAAICSKPPLGDLDIRSVDHAIDWLEYCTRSGADWSHRPANERSSRELYLALLDPTGHQYNHHLARCLERRICFHEDGQGEARVVISKDPLEHRTETLPLRGGMTGSQYQGR